MLLAKWFAGSIDFSWGASVMGIALCDPEVNRMFMKAKSKSRFMLWAVALAGSIVTSSAYSQSSQAKQSPSAAAAKPTAAASPHRYQADRFAGRAGKYYALVWGIDSVGVKAVESGEMIRFSYRVLDASKAATLNDKKLEPSLIDERAHVKLVVPTMEKVGQLRQSSPPEAGKVYWMLFSNKGGYVKRGDRVNVVIGNFHANGLVVD